MRAVGIDLGTTNSVVAYIAPSGKPEVIRDAEGRNTVPSVISFEGATPVIGHDAKERQSQSAGDVVAFFKRNMGDAHFEVQFHGQRYSAIDLSALVLGKLKAQAEAFLREPVTDAVITVPAYFTNPERQATIEAGRRAGLHVIAIINEPTAAALAYGLRPSADAERTVLVYDLGGGTFDITVVQITPTDLNVIATDGDHALGGKDWDERLILSLQSQFQQEFGVELQGDDLNQLLVNAEQLKKTLTGRQSGTIRVQAAGHAATYTITREQFDGLTADLLERTRYLTNQVLTEAGLAWPAISGVLPVGGSTRMPQVRELIEQMSGKAPMSGINEDEAVALGAAIKASLEMAPTTMLLGARRTRDVMAHSLGMIAESEARDRYLNSVLIKKNLPIPSQETRPYSMQMRRSGDTTMEVFLTQGETDDPQDSVYLGAYTFSGFPSVQGQAVVDVTYAYDANGVVSVSAVERSTGQPLSLTVGPVPPDVPARFLKKPSEVAQASREHMTIYLAFDLSGSMSGAPLDEAKKAALAFVQQCDLSITSIGLIGFSDSVRVYQDATQDVNKITHAIRSLSIGPTGFGNAGHPFDILFDKLSQMPGIRYGIVLADGVWSAQDLAIRQAKRCHQAQIDIIAIGFGGADEAFLRAIASTSEGSIFTHQGGLADAFSTIARELTEGGGQGRANRGLRG